MKVRAVRKYHDLQIKRIIDKGETFEADEKRAAYLEEQGMVKPVAAAKTGAAGADGKER